MKAYLGSQDVRDVFKGSFEEPADCDEQTVAQIVVLKRRRVKDKTTMYALYRVVEDTILQKLVNATT